MYALMHDSNYCSVGVMIVYYIGSRGRFLRDGKGHVSV